MKGKDEENVDNREVEELKDEVKSLHENLSKVSLLHLLIRDSKNSMNIKY